MKFSLTSMLEKVLMVAEKNVFCNYENEVEKTNLDSLISSSYLFKSQEELVKIEAQAAFDKEKSVSWMDMFSCSEKKTSQNKSHDQYIITLLCYLRIRADTCADIFCLANRSNDILAQIDTLRQGARPSIFGLKIDELCALLKKCIKLIRNGILSCDIGRILLDKSKEKLTDDYKRLLRYLPFLLTKEEKEIICSLFDIFYKIDEIKDDFKINTLLKEFATLLFPKEIFRSSEDLENLKKITLDIHNCLLQ